MASESGSKPLRMFLLLVVVFAVGILGVFSGNLIRAHFYQNQSPMLTARPSRSLLHAGLKFPNAVLLRETGDAVRTRDLMAPDGAVVLFLDVECPPCVAMSLKWQRLLDDGSVPNLRVIGVMNRPAATIDAFRRDHDIRFPVLADSSHLFLRSYQVDRFPLEVWVDHSGRVAATSYDAERAIDVEALTKQMHG
jgi:peroxiredoxin